jgi:hypothetical protein
LAQKSGAHVQQTRGLHHEEVGQEVHLVQQWNYALDFAVNLEKKYVSKSIIIWKIIKIFTR